jgi:hypothetical protein
VSHVRSVSGLYGLLRARAEETRCARHRLAAIIFRTIDPCHAVSCDLRLDFTVDAIPGTGRRVRASVRATARFERRGERRLSVDPPLLPDSTPWPPRRTRQLGALILAVSLLAAGGIYWSEIRSAETPDGELLAGYERQRNHDMGVMYGRGGRDLMNALQTVDSPAGHAILVIGAGLIGAGLCLRRARQVEEHERS